MAKEPFVWMWAGRPAAPEQLAYAFRILVTIAQTGRPGPDGTQAPQRGRLIQ